MTPPPSPVDSDASTPPDPSFLSAVAAAPVVEGPRRCVLLFTIAFYLLWESLLPALITNLLWLCPLADLVVQLL